MGNWHCISSSCATVYYREYEPPKVRWQYPNEPWQEIKGDDYSVETKVPNFTGGQCEGGYRVHCRWDGIPKASCFIEGKITSVKCVVTKFDRFVDGYGVVVTNDKGRTVVSTNYSGSLQNPNSNVVEIEPYGAANNCGNPPTACVFKVLKKGQVVHTETRTVCPEVQKIPCKLSSLGHSIEIKKLPYLEKVEVVPYQYSAYRSPSVPAPIVQADKIPAECLNIYNNAIYVIPPSGQGIYPNGTPFDSFVAQICSAPGCPPPEYQVICDCDSCESCPDGTCAVECDQQICCYDTATGKAIKTIAVANYCGEQS
jgi:hypothetical protein